jgi:catalase
MTAQKKLTTVAGAPVADNQNTMTAGPRGPVLLQDVWFLEKGALRPGGHPRAPHAREGLGRYRRLHRYARHPHYTKAKLFSEVGKQTEMLAR